MISENGKGAPTSGKVESALMMSLVDGPDSTESTATTRAAQDMPTPRAWTGATGGTSQAAARSARQASTPICKAILTFITDNGPSSCEQIADVLRVAETKLLLNTVRARVCDLHKAGFLIDSGLRGVGESGRSRVVCWQIAPVTEGSDA